MKINTFIEHCGGYENLTEEDKELLGHLQQELWDITEENGTPLYFRDSYNNSSIMQQLNLSWWRDVIPLLNDDGVLGLEDIAHVIELIEMSGKPTKESILSIHAARREQTKYSILFEQYPNNYKDDMTEEGVKEALEYFTSKYDNLVNFFKYALEQKYTVTASLWGY